MVATRTIYHVLLRGPQTSEAISIRSRDPTICLSSHRVHCHQTFFFLLGYFFLTLGSEADSFKALPGRTSVMAQRGGCPTPLTALAQITLAQISSLRHGLLAPSVGFHQTPVRSSQGKRLQSIICQHPFGFAGKKGRKTKCGGRIWRIFFFF